MGNLRYRFLSSSLGVMAALSGTVLLSRCGGGGCGACYGCAAAGGGALFTAVISRFITRKEGARDGMA